MYIYRCSDHNKHVRNSRYALTAAQALRDRTVLQGAVGFYRALAKRSRPSRLIAPLVRSYTLAVTLRGWHRRLKLRQKVAHCPKYNWKF